MKRGWIGLGLLLILLVAGLLVTGHMGRNHRKISRELDMAAAHALAGDWEEALEETRDAWEDWEEGWHFSAAFADHEPMEEIDALFAQLEAYRKTRDAVAFAAVCRQLAKQVEAMGDAHQLNWWNLL